MKETNRRGSFFDFLLGDTIKRSLREGDLASTIDFILGFLKEAVKADFIAVTIWDLERDLAYLHRFISDGKLSLPPAKPGRGPLGVCMVEKRTIWGEYSEFYGSLSKLAEKIGPVLCIPLEIPRENLVGAIGIGRVLGAAPFTEWADINLRVGSNIVSLIVSLGVMQDLLDKQNRVLDGLFELLTVIMETKAGEEQLEGILYEIKHLFSADAVVIAKVEELEGKVYPVFSIGVELEKPIDFGKGILGLTAKHKRPMRFSSYPLEIVPEGYERLAAITGSAMTIPVFLGDKLVYIIGVVRNKRSPAFSREDFYFFTLFQRIFDLIFTFMSYEKEKEQVLELRSRIARIESLGTLAGGIAHDFNNILNIIMGYSQLGMEESKDSQCREFFKLIFDQCRRAADLISQILLLSREHRMDKQPLNLRPLVKEIVKLICRTFPEDIEVKYADDGHEEYTVLGNPSFIQTMLLNLATNAKDAMPEGGTLEILLKKGEFPPSLDYKKRRAVVIEVKDTGKGIPPEIIDRIFDPFFTTKEVGKGTGLGLSQVHAVVTEMGGFIDVESKPGAGTTFIIYLPEVSKEEKLEIADAKTDSVSLPKCVFIVEDNASVVRVMEKMLEKLGVKSISVTNSVRAEKVFSEVKDEVEVVICDIVMPHISGFEIAERIKRIKPEVKIVFMTGYANKAAEMEELLKRLGAKVLMKPFTMKELEESLRLD